MPPPSTSSALRMSNRCPADSIWRIRHAAHSAAAGHPQLMVPNCAAPAPTSCTRVPAPTQPRCTSWPQPDRQPRAAKHPRPEASAWASSRMRRSAMLQARADPARDCGAPVRSTTNMPHGYRPCSTASTWPLVLHLVGIHDPQIRICGRPHSAVHVPCGVPAAQSTEMPPLPQRLWPSGSAGPGPQRPLERP